MNRVEAVAIVKHHLQNDGHNLLLICQNTTRQQHHICSWGCSHRYGTELLPTHSSSSSQCSSLFWFRCPVSRQLRMSTPRTVILCSLHQFLMKFYCILIIIILYFMSYDTKFIHPLLIVWDVCLSCVVQESVYYFAEMGTMRHCT